MRRVSSSQDGFTLIEVMISIFILGSIVLAMAASASKYLSVATKNRMRIQANATAEAQIALVRVSPNYDSLTVKFDSTKSNTPMTGYTRTTSVVRTGAGTTARHHPCHRDRDRAAALRRRSSARSRSPLLK